MYFKAVSYDQKTTVDLSLLCVSPFFDQNTGISPHKLNVRLATRHKLICVLMCVIVIDGNTILSVYLTLLNLLFFCTMNLKS